MQGFCNLSNSLSSKLKQFVWFCYAYDLEFNMTHWVASEEKYHHHCYLLGCWTSLVALDCILCVLEPVRTQQVPHFFPCFPKMLSFSVNDWTLSTAYQCFSGPTHKLYLQKLGNVIGAFFPSFSPLFMISIMYSFDWLLDYHLHSPLYLIQLEIWTVPQLYSAF
jgi:hypothetical protein